MTILGLHFQCGLILASSSKSDKYERGLWQTPVQLTEDVYCVCTTHVEGCENLRKFVEIIRMECDQQYLTPVTVAKQIQQKMLKQGEAQSYIQFIVGGMDRTSNQLTLYSIINGVLLQCCTYCIDAYEGKCRTIQGYMDSKYRTNMERKDAISLVRKILTVHSTDIVIDMIVLGIDKPIKRFSFYKDEATKFASGVLDPKVPAKSAAQGDAIDNNVHSSDESDVGGNQDTDKSSIL